MSGIRDNVSSRSPRTFTATPPVPQFAVLWFDPRTEGGAFTVPIVQRDADIKARLAFAIRSAREQVGLSRPQLGAMVGVGRGAVLAWEKGDSVPSLLNLGALCDALQVDADLFAHPPEIPENPVARYRLERESKHLANVSG